MATYSTHNSPVMEWVQTRGRMRSNKAMISRNNLCGMVGALKKGEAVWFAPDQDGRKGSSFALFAVKDGDNQRYLCDFAVVRRRHADRDDGEKG